MTITYDASKSVYLWRNKANVEWILHPTIKEDELRVDNSNPYYSVWKIARVTSEGIYGTGGDLYTRMN